MTLDVVVSNAAGTPVSGLQPEDFTLLDNGQQQGIVSLRSVNGMKGKTDPPVEVIFLIDAINSPFQTVASDRQWLSAFFKENGGELALPTSLVILTDYGINLQSRPTRDGKDLHRFLDANPSGLWSIKRSQGAQGRLDREYSSLGALDVLAQRLSEKPGRKLLIWLSHGWGVISNPGWIGGEKDREAIYGTIASVSTELRKARITLYCVSPYGGFGRDEGYVKYLKGVYDSSHADLGDLLLPVLATQTGGQVPYGGNDLGPIIDRCIKDAQSFYVLTFNPPPAAHSNEYHRIEVRVDKPGLSVRTRAGYYANPTAPEEPSLSNAPLETAQVSSE